jgi:hypothetical protein
VSLAPDASLEEVRQVLLGHPDADLAFAVGDDAARATAVARLLDALEAATPQGRAAGAGERR